VVAHGKNTPIVVDPKHAFGAPSVASAAVTTATLFASFRANKSAEMVADWFGVTLDEVRAAVRFRQSHVRGAKLRDLLLDENISHRQANMLRALRET